MGNNGTDRPAVVIWYWIWFALDTEIGNESVVVRALQYDDNNRLPPAAIRLRYRPTECSIAPTDISAHVVAEKKRKDSEIVLSPV